MTENLSPYSRYLRECEKGSLCFQSDKSGNAIFPPRVDEASDKGPLEWKVSKGEGTIYSATTVFSRNDEPFVLALVDMDEGFRMMSRIVKSKPENISIGDRVKAKFCSLEVDGPVLPVFEKERQVS